MNPVIAIDIGTTSTKVLAVLPTGNVQAQHQVFYPTHYPQPGFAEQDAGEILQAVLTGLKIVLDELSYTDSPVLVFSSAMHSMVAVDESGKALTPLIIWADTRSTEQANQLKADGVANALHDQTGTPVHPMSPLCKLMWLQQHHANLHASAFKFISIKEFVIFHLTGFFLVDYSIASATGLFDIHKRAWSLTALEFAGITAAKLSEPVEVTHTVPVHKNLAFGQARIIIGASDGCLAQLGSGALKPGIMTVTLGTSGAVRCVASPQLKDPQHRLFNYILWDNQTVAGGATNNGTAVLDWFVKELAEPQTTLSHLVDSVCLNIPRGSDGLLALPFLQGERAPIYNAEARGVFFNISMQHTRQHFVRALLESVCYELKWIAESVEEVCGEPDQIIVSGGITHFPVWVQMLADILNRPLLVSSQHDASAMGAARLAFHTLSVSFETSAEGQAKFVPDYANTTAYMPRYSAFKDLYSAIAGSFSVK